MFFTADSTLQPVSAGGPTSAAGGLLATTLEGDVYIVELASGNVLHRFTGDGESVIALALAPDLSVVVSASRSGQLHVYGIPEGEEVHTFARVHESGIRVLSFDASSTLVAAGCVSGAIQVYDVRSQRVLTHELKGHGGLVTSAAFYGELGSRKWLLASGGDDGKVLIWDLVSSKLVKNIQGAHTSAVDALRWTSSGDALLSGSRDRTICVFSNGEVKATVPVQEEVRAVLTLLGKYIVVATATSVKVLDLRFQQVGETVVGAEDAVVSGMFAGEAEDQVLVTLSDDTVCELSVAQLDSGIEVNTVRTLSTNHGEIIDVVCGNQDLTVLATNSKDVRVLHLQQNKLEFAALKGHTDIVICLSLLNGRWLLTGGKDKEARLWDLESKECKVTFTGHTGAIGACALSRNGVLPKFALTGSQDLTVKKWGADGSAEWTRKAHDKDINAIAVNEANTHFATASQDRTLKVWSIQGEVVGVLRGHRRGVWSASFAPGNTLVSGSGDKTVRQWSLADYSCLRTFEGHLNSVLRVVVFKPGVFASAGGDGLVKVWEQSTGECATTLDNHTDKVWALAVADGSLVSGGGDGVLNVWQDHTEERKLEESAMEEALVLKQQELDNCVRAKEWDKAVRLALELDRPLRLLRVLSDAREQGMESVVDQCIADLEKGPLLRTLIKQVRDWNTNGRTFETAQHILRVLLHRADINELAEDTEIRSSVRALLPYTGRHLARAGELLEASYTLDYTLKQMAI